ncbi:SymE family type I addiction module toxin [Xenorhabdus innexi]|uniref:Uncharacterized protein n=1 Tax=Xenorhabdus innexi TaxID=290109 RepID=A0A1N6N1C5_9GAMM|nr:SymE family type I addiction module toxin [Xenorhabdus innexi]PHM36988.1 hypothetical protein Xinn_01259 [Xenorhabdus innexi]SIP74901.1 conserved hypothetical protein [Xenorhabdus innexi]
MSLHVLFRHTDMPELTLSGSALSDAGFGSDSLFHISQHSDEIIISLLAPETDLANLIHEIENKPEQGIDNVRENGELYIAGDWLTDSQLIEQPINVEITTGKIILKPKQ